MPEGGDAVRKAIYVYALSHLSQSKKVSFFYALKGRYGKPGMMQRYGVTQLAKSVLIVPPEHEAEIESFLKEWGCSYAKRGMVMAE